MLKDLYNRKYHAEVWHPLALNPTGWSTTRYDDVARLLERESGSVLELGCGAGQLLIALAARDDRFGQLVGLDISDVRIQTATSALEAHPALARRIQFHAADAERPLPFDDRSYDVVICCAVLEHVVDVFSFMREIARVCRPGGAAVITVPNLGYVKHLVGLCLGRLPLTGIATRDMASWEAGGWDGGHLHYFTQEALRALLRHAGFRDEQWTSDGRWARLRRRFRPLAGNLTVLARRIV